MEKICSGIGVRLIMTSDIRAALREAVEMAMWKERCNVFYCGVLTPFDSVFAEVVDKIRRDREEDVRLVGIKPFKTTNIGGCKDFFEMTCDEIYVPSDLKRSLRADSVHCTNAWMVDRAEVVISYLTSKFGTAYELTEYAKFKNKTVIEIPNFSKNDL